MNTPIADYIKAYNEKHTIRMHMPGHKGRMHLGPEAMDITEVQGADVLYHAEGIIAESEENAAGIFKTARTIYSTEGSSLCIRAMLYIVTMAARKKGRSRAVIAAGRNAHKTFITAAGLLNAEVHWMYGDAESIISCRLSPDSVDQYITENAPDAVYITSPDYLGTMADIRGIAEVCHAHGCMLLVDNAHGAYLAFEGRHPIALGADMCCDSAHKTLPVLTGGAYLHISENAPDLCSRAAEQAMSMFASTSPSYLILQSLDLANKLMSKQEFKIKLKAFSDRVGNLKEELINNGWRLAGEESIKLTICPKSSGYTGDELADILRAHNIEPEFSDPDYLVLMFSADTDMAELDCLQQLLLSTPHRLEITDTVPRPHPGKAMMSIADALFSNFEIVPVDKAEGRILAEPGVTCPPAVPIAVCGELLDAEAIRAFRYYGIEKLKVCK